MRQFDSLNSAAARVLLVSLSAAIVSACGGSDSASTASAQATSATQSFSLNLAAPSAAASSVVEPTFHLAPVILEEPEDTDRSEPASSATLTPHRVTVDPSFSQLSTRRLTPQVLEQVRDTGTAPEHALADGSTERPMATTSSVTVYTPAQIRAAYGMPALPSTAANLTSAQAAQMGAGQTIYLIDAPSDPNIAAELASFDSKFGIPGCTVTPIAVTASLPLARAPLTGCTFSIVYSTPSGAMTATVPSASAASTWATEIAMDVEWSHATAPYARIILIETPDAGGQSMVGAVQLANLMGPGVVSQSFGALEQSGAVVNDAIYSAANMTYLASTGDNGAQVNWPAVSSHVLAVGGTSLTYSGSGPRTETVWSGTGGGVSASVATPAYQALAVPGLTNLGHRTVTDVTFNGNPYTGQYLAVMSPGTTNIGYYAAGGTSIAAPQWAGIITIANALRAQSALAPIGASQPALYGLGLNSASYASNFLDVTQGSDGTCTTCYAGVGYDLPSGLGSPNVQSLLGSLSAQPLAVAPVVSAATVSGKVGTVLSFSITATDAHTLTYSLTGAPAGMGVNASTGLVTWSAPVQGSYSVTAQALDASSGLSGQATLGVTIIPAVAPQVQGGSVGGTAQVALSFVPQVTDANVVTLSLTGAPAGMSVNAAGVVTWTSPLAGTYAVTVNAHDASTGLSGQGTYMVTIVAPQAPTVPSASLSFPVGKALSFLVNAIDANTLTYSLTGAPAGMTIGNTGLLSWSTPTSGTYAVTVTAKDTKTGLTGKGVYTITVTAKGPAIVASSLTGIAGQALSGSIAFTDTSASSISVTIGGAPAGMGFTVSGSASAGEVLAVKWSSPVTGVYSMKVTVTDSQKLTATATIPVTITAH